jgi:hypothetical protein
VPGGPVDKANALAREHEHDPTESEHGGADTDHSDADTVHEHEPANKLAREPVVRSGDTLVEIHPGEPGMFDT